MNSGGVYQLLVAIFGKGVFPNTGSLKALRFCLRSNTPLPHRQKLSSETAFCLRNLIERGLMLVSTDVLSTIYGTLTRSLANYGSWTLHPDLG